MPPKTQTDAAAAAMASASSTVADTAATPPPRLGETVQVLVAEGVTLINNETGTPFVPGQPTPQTVTLTTLRRLTDGDFALA